MATKWVPIPMDDEDIHLCMEHGQLMRDGGVKLANVKHRDIDNAENYTDGKIGELAFWRWLGDNDIQMPHIPFRNDYTVLNPDDDFIIVVNGRRVKVEVRHKTRNVAPQRDYEHCSDFIKSDRIYVFTERHRPNKEDKTKNGEALRAEHFRGGVHLIGWASSNLLTAKAQLIPAGTQRRNNGGSVNFTSRRDEFNIFVRGLSDMTTLIPTLSR